MDVLPRITRQLFELFRAMSSVQRATFVVVPALVLAGLTWLVLFNRPDDHQAVLFGKSFVGDELAVAEKALNQAGLLNYRRDDRRLLAPAGELDRYNAALVEFDAVPSDLGSQILKQFESLGPFSTDRHRQEMKDALLLQELRRMIKAVPDIEDARVAVASSGRRVGFGQKSRVTANVTVKPRPGRELSSRLVVSIRQAVASMVPDLLPGDVTVFDVASGQAYSGEQTDNPLDGQMMQRFREFTRQYEQQIQKALAFIPNVSVVVHVDLDNLKSSVSRRERIRVTAEDSTIANRPGRVQQAGHDNDEADTEAVRHAAGFRGADGYPTDFTREVNERELLAAMPRAVQVSVSIPGDYYRDVAARRRSQGETNSRRLGLDSIEEEVLTKVERTVSRLIPAGSPHDAISVTTVDRMPVEIEIPVLTMTDQLAVLAWRHGGTGALGLLVICALWMLSRISAASPTAIQPAPAFEPERFPLSQAAAAPASVAEAPIAAPPVASRATPPPRVKESVPTPGVGDFAEDLPQPIREFVSPIAESSAAIASSPIEPAAPFVSIESRDAPVSVPGPFDFLAAWHPDDIRQFLQDEQSQTIAVVAAQLSPALSAAVLAGFPPDRQADVLYRVSRLGSTDPEVLRDIATALRERLESTRVRAAIPQATAVLHRSPRMAAPSMLATEADDETELADELRQTLFSFDDLLKVDDDTLRVILRETDDRQWALALKASPEPVRQKVLACLPPRVARAFKQEMDSIGAVRLSEMTSVRQQIADSIRRLEDSGKIALSLN